MQAKYYFTQAKNHYDNRSLFPLTFSMAISTLRDDVSRWTAFSKKLIRNLVLLVIAIIFFSSCFFVVSPTERAIKITLGNLSNTVYREGFHFKLPFFQSVEIIDLTIDRADAVAKSASKDLQNIVTTVAVNYQINEAGILEMYKLVGVNHESIENNVFSSAIQEAVKSATAKYTAEELITKRELVRNEIETILKDKTEKYGLVISQVNIVNFEFSSSFDASIESKVKAEQDALTQRNKLEQVKYEAQQQIERAKAEAETIRIQAEAIQKQGGAAYVQLKWIEKWDGKLPATSLGDGTIPNIFINK